MLHRTISILVFLFGVTVFAEQSYPQRVHLLSHEESSSQRFYSERGSNFIDTRIELGVLNLNVRIDSSLSTYQLQADSVLTAMCDDDSWYVLVLKNDSLWSITIHGRTPPSSQFLTRISSPRVQSTSRDHVTVLSSDSAFFLRVASTTGHIQVNSLDCRQRRVVYALNDSSQTIVVSSLNGEMLGVERFIDGRSQNLGVISSIEGLLCANSRLVAGLSIRNGLVVVQSLSLSAQNARTQSVRLPSGFYEPLAVVLQQDTIGVIFSNGVVRIVGSDLISADFCALRELSFGMSVIMSKNSLVLSDRFHHVRLTVIDDPWYRFRVLIDAVRNYGLWIGGILLIIFLALQGQRYRRQLRDVIEVPSRGISFVVDKNMRLRRMNSHARELFEMDTTTPLHRVLKFYCHGDSQRVVESFVSSALAVRSPQSQKLVIKSDGSDKEIIFNAQPLHSLTGAFDGLVIHGVDITEELERKRIVNWAQLAHDMQTNLSIIKLNAEQIAGGIAPDREDQRVRIVHQASLLLQRVRDIVSIGRDEQLHLSEIDLRSLCHEVVREFDDNSLGQIQFITPQRSMIARIDTAKMQRALRNAVENAIRALHERRGEICFDYQLTKSHLVLSVRDNGIGMDEQTKINFFRPYFSNYRRFGGTGIGTMIMQRAIEIHGGNIEVHTAPGSGTTILFNLPSTLYVHG